MSSLTTSSSQGKSTREAATRAPSAPTSTTASSRSCRLARSRAQEGEPKAEQEPRARPRALEAAEAERKRPGQSTRLRHEEGAHVEPVEAGGLQVGPDVGELELPRVQIEHELHLRIAGDALEQRAQVPRGVDRAEDGRRL